MKRLPKLNFRLLVLFLITTVFTGIGGWCYDAANHPPDYEIPDGALHVGIGPADIVAPISTKMIFWVPENKISLEVFFNFTEIEKCFIYVTLPYEVLSVNPYINYQNSRDNYFNSTSSLGEVTSNFKYFIDEGSSGINVTFIPNKNFHFSDSIGLSIEIKVSKLTSISYSLDSKQTLIVTLFGGQGNIWNDEFTSFIGTNHLLMDEYPFQLYVQFPEKSYLSSDTFPAPDVVYVTEGFRSAEFDLNFSSPYPEWRGVSVSCSFINPDNEKQRDNINFISGILLTIGITAGFELILELLGRGKEKMNQTKEKETLKKRLCAGISKILLSPTYLPITLFSVFILSFLLLEILTSFNILLFSYIDVLQSLDYLRAKDIITLIVTSDASLVAFTGVISTMVLKNIIQTEKEQKSTGYTNVEGGAKLYATNPVIEKRHEIIKFIVLIVLSLTMSIGFGLGALMTSDFVFSILLSFTFLLMSIIEILVMLVFALEM